MKKRIKLLALLGIAAMLSLVLVSCGTPTPEEVFEQFDSENARLEMLIEFSELTKVEMVMRMDGDKCKVTTVSTAFGVELEEESYLEEIDDDIYEYTKQEDGSWTKAPYEEDDDDTDIDELEALFDSKNYNKFDEENSKYVMKDDVKIEAEDMLFSNAVIEVGEDSYTLSADITMTEEGIELTGRFKMMIGEFGEISVTLPKVE